MYIYIFATKCRRPYLFQNMMSVWLNNLSLKYQQFTPSGCKDAICLRTVLNLNIWFADTISNFNTERRYLQVENEQKERYLVCFLVLFSVTYLTQFRKFGKVSGKQMFKKTVLKFWIYFNRNFCYFSELSTSNFKSNILMLQIFSCAEKDCF